MHLGYVKCAAEHTSLARELQDRQRQMGDTDAMRDTWAASIPGGPNQFQMAQFERRVGEMKQELEKAHGNYQMFDATLLDPVLLGETCRFYRLVAVWLRWVGEGSLTNGGASPLASPVKGHVETGDGTVDATTQVGGGGRRDCYRRFSTTNPRPEILGLASGTPGG